MVLVRRVYYHVRVAGALGMPTREVALVAIAAMLFACRRPAPGDACEKGKATCLDAKTELQCQAGKLMAAPCRGAKGCDVAADMQTCDFSANVEGDVCSADDENIAQCAADNKKARVVCKAGKYILEACKGPGGCSEDGGDKVRCDGTLADEGDACPTDEPSYFTCSVDKKEALRCETGKLVIDEHCRGPGGCDASNGADLACDRGPQSIGDPCGAEGDYECNAEKNTLLVCKEKRWSLEHACKAECVSTEKTADCKD